MAAHQGGFSEKLVFEASDNCRMSYSAGTWPSDLLGLDRGRIRTIRMRRSLISEVPLALRVCYALIGEQN